MNKTINRVGMGFLAVFAGFCVWVVYDLVVREWPQTKCEKSGQWFASKWGHCGRVIYLPDITHRKAGVKAAKAAADARAVTSANTPPDPHTAASAR